MWKSLFLYKNAQIDRLQLDMLIVDCNCILQPGLLALKEHLNLSAGT